MQEQAAGRRLLGQPPIGRQRSEMEDRLVGAIRHINGPAGPTRADRARRGGKRARRREAASAPDPAGTTDSLHRSWAEAKPARRKSTRAQKQAVAELDNFDPQKSERRKVTLPALVPPRSQSAADDARVAIAEEDGRSVSCDPIGQTTMVWEEPHPTQMIDKRTTLRTMFSCANDTRRLDVHKRRSVPNLKRIQLDHETRSLYDPEAPSRLATDGVVPWNHRTGYGNISEIDDETSRAPLPKELKELIAKWAAMYRTARGHGGTRKSKGKKGEGALSDLALFEKKVGQLSMSTAAGFDGVRGGGAGGAGGDMAMVDDGEKVKRWPGAKEGLHEALKGKNAPPTPVIRLGRGNGHGPKRQRQYTSKRVMRPIASEQNAFDYARAAYGKHYNYLLSERAMDLLRGLMSPRPTEAK